MKKTIFLAVLISLGIWVATFDSFFDSNRLVLSFAIALAVALGLVALVSSLTKSVPLQLVVVAIGTIAVLFALSQLLPAQSCPPMPITISCGPANATPENICIDRGSNIEWITAGVADGIMVQVHDFKKKRIWPFPPKKESPLVSDPPPGSNAASIRAKVRQDRHGRYKYSVTCTSESGPADTRDPMIEVPR